MKDRGEVFTPCHLGAQWRLWHLASVCKLLFLPPFIACPKFYPPQSLIMPVYSEAGCYLLLATVGAHEWCLFSTNKHHSWALTVPTVNNIQPLNFHHQAWLWHRTARRTMVTTEPIKRLLSSARVSVQSSSERVRSSWNSAEASRQCCLCSLSFAPLPGVQVA